MRDYLRLIKWVKPYWGLLAAAVVCMLASSIFSGGSLGMIIPLVDKILAGKPIELPLATHAPLFFKNFISQINTWSSIQLLNRLILGVLFIFFFKEIFDFFSAYLMNDIGQRVIRNVREEIYNKLVQFSLDFYGKAQTGVLVSRITYDTGIIKEAISDALADIIFQTFQFLAYLIVVISVTIYFEINWKLIVLSLFLIPLIIYPVFKIGRRIRKISTQSQQKMADINSSLFETISGITIIKSFLTEQREKNKFAKYNYQFYKMALKTVKRVLIISPMTEFVGLICAAAVLWVGGRQVVSGALSPGAFITFLAGLLSIIKPVKKLSRVHTVNQQALAACKRIFEILDKPVSVAEAANPLELPALKEKIVFDHIWFGYEEKDILTDINTEVKKGEVLAIVGPSGVGKSTLANLLLRFYDPKKGQIKIDNLDIKQAKLADLRRQIGLVSQDTFLFNDTVAYNIGYGMPEASIEKIKKAAQAARADNFITKLPQGYDTVIGDRGFRLSGGEKQRLAIARAILKNPPILILDEATSQLDTQQEVLVQEAIEQLMKGRTVLVIAHRLSTIRYASKIIVLDKGKIVQSGRHEELISAEGLYKRLYEMQFRE